MDPPFPNLRHLRICLSVAKTGSISSASARVHLSQPAISQAIAKMENNLATVLFLRHSGGMAATPIGQSYFKRAEKALNLLRQGAAMSLRSCPQTTSAHGNLHFHRFLTATQLRALISLARANNFTIAAHASGVSQPSLHRAARDLEKLSGMKLFRAHQRGVTLTKCAEILVRYCMLAASELRHADAEIQERFSEKSVRLYIGSLPLARSKILPASIKTLITKYKNVQVQITDGPYNEQLKKLCNGDIDFILGALRQRDIAKGVVQETLFGDKLTIVVGKSHPLAKQTNVTTKNLLQYAWIAPPLDTPTGQYLSAKLGIAEMQSTPVKVVSSSLRLVRALLLSGDFITIISTHQIKSDLDQGHLTSIQMDMSDSHREIGLTYRDSWQPTLLQKEFLNIIRSVSSGFDTTP